MFRAVIDVAKFHSAPTPTMYLTYRSRLQTEFFMSKFSVLKFLKFLYNSVCLFNRVY